MALTNFSLPFGALTSPWSPSSSPLHPIHQQLAAHTNNLLYSPAEHQQQADGLLPPLDSNLYKNNPYALPQQQQQQQQQSLSSPSISGSSSNPTGTGASTATTTSQFHFNVNNRRKNTYLPPLPPPGAINTKYNGNRLTFSQQQQHQQQQQQPRENEETFDYQTGSTFNTPSHNTNNNNNINHNNQHLLSSFSEDSSHEAPHHAQHGYFEKIRGITTTTTTTTSSASTPASHQFQHQHYNNNNDVARRTNPYGAAGVKVQPTTINLSNHDIDNNNNKKAENPPDTKEDDDDEYKHNRKYFPERPPGFTRVQAGKGSRTQVHAVLDYDFDGEEEEQEPIDDYHDGISEGNHSNASPIFPTAVTPVQGPIYVKNGTVPVVPLYSYPTINNGTLIQIPIWWTALSVALGLNVNGDIIKGVPCIKRYNQLFCPKAGNNYPIEKIEHFIDENKALMRRMYGDFEMSIDNVLDGSRQKSNKRKRKRRFIDDPDLFVPPGVFHSAMLNDDDNEADIHPEEPGETYFGKLRNKRQANRNRNAKQTNRSGGSVGGGIGVNSRSSNTQSTGRVDACESKIEIVTPYWASNSAGKIRAIVNTQHFEQAIHQEICSKAQTSRCQNECGCEQKYKWHRLLAYDPDNDCKGIFMDWFLFPSCCVCRCNP